MDWYDRAAQDLEDSLANGEITQKEFNYEMRELNREYQQAREDTAQDAYDNY